ncbi:hypothetical protein BC826DRAFT_975340 [Russula brevipes]|nr:hypothetical protein BC826DRAFT_975340 [Russula brevipes]
MSWTRMVLLSMAIVLLRFARLHGVSGLSSPTNDKRQRNGKMEKICEELRLCKGHWKAEQIAIDYYSSWRNARIKNGLFNISVNGRKRVKMEDQETNNDDSNFSAIDNNQVLVERPPKRKKRKPNTTGNASEGEATSDRVCSADTRKPRPSMRPVNTEPPTPSAAPAPSMDLRPQIAPLSSPTLDSLAEEETIANTLGHVAITPAPMFPSISVTTGPCPTANAAVPASARADTHEPRPSARSVNTEPPTPSAAPAPSTDLCPQSASLSSPTLDSSASLTDTTRSAIGKGKTSTRVQAADRPFELGKEMKPTAHNFTINEWLSVPGNEGRAQSKFRIYWNSLSCQDKKKFKTAAKNSKTDRKPLVCGQQ